MTKIFLVIPLHDKCLYQISAVNGAADCDPIPKSSAFMRAEIHRNHVSFPWFSPATFSGAQKPRPAIIGNCPDWQSWTTSNGK